MSYEDDPPEPTEEEMAQARASEAIRDTPLRLEGLKASHIDAVIRAILEDNYHLSDRANDQIDRLCKKTVADIAKDVLEARLTAAVDAVIAGGFPVFDSFSGRETKRTSLAEMVHVLLNAKDNYGNGETFLNRALREALKKLFDGELKSLTEKMAAEFKRQADDVFKAKVITAMKEAIGLR